MKKLTPQQMQTNAAIAGLEYQIETLAERGKLDKITLGVIRDRLDILYNSLREERNH